MKRFILFLLFITLYNCSSVRVNNWGYVKGWAVKEMPPSQIVKNGDSFFDGKLSDGRIFEVFGDETIDSDGKYYYNALYQDLGWYTKGDSWEADAGTFRPKRGHLYINIKRGVAIYLFPENNFSAFKVKVYPKGTILLDPLLNN